MTTGTDDSSKTKAAQDDIATQVADVLELVMHEYRRNRVTAFGHRVGLSDHGIIRLNLDGIGRLVARVVAGEYDPEQVKRLNAAYRRALKRSGR